MGALWGTPDPTFRIFNCQKFAISDSGFFSQTLLSALHIFLLDIYTSLNFAL